jgi:Carboxypeptidase regulatory-like domain
MRLQQISLIASVSLAGLLSGVGFPVIAVQAQSPSVLTGQALTGQVSSSEEGPMEGVLVSARRDGSSITTTVVTDDKGHYAFPAAKMEPGHYTMAIRAVGYRLDGPKSVDIQAGATADLTLSKNKNLAAQLSNGEWLTSLPGADKQKAFLTQCVGCHTMRRSSSSCSCACRAIRPAPRPCIRNRCCRVRAASARPSPAQPPRPPPNSSPA